MINEPKPKTNLVLINLIAVVATELLFEVFGVVLIAGLHAHHNAAIFDAAFVLSSMLFGDARAHQRAYQAAREATGSSTSQSSCQRTRDNQAQTRQRYRSTNSRN